MVQILSAPIVSAVNKLSVAPHVTIREGVAAQLKSPISWGISAVIGAFAAVKTYRDVKASVRKQDELQIKNDVLEQVMQHEGFSITSVKEVPESKRAWRDGPKAAASHTDRLESETSTAKTPAI